MKIKLKLAVIIILIVVLSTSFFLFLPKKINVSKQSKQCIKCHLEKNINIVQIQEWKKSAHAKSGVGCFECHQAKLGEKDAWNHKGYIISTIVSPLDCSRCHKKEFEEFDRSHHAKAGEILGSLDNYLGEVIEGENASIQGCQYCHGSLVKMRSDTDKTQKGKFDPATWPNLGIGRLNPDGSKGSCSACHAKHAFSLAVARSPESCGKCHMGPDHPQIEIYNESKHGIIYNANKQNMDISNSNWILGKNYTQAPNCVTCHMGSNKNLTSTHDLGERLSMNLRSIVSKPRENSVLKKSKMQKVCKNCHGPEWYSNFYNQFYNTVELYNKRYAKPASEIIKLLRQEKKINNIPFDEDIEWIYFELWHHEGRRLRHGAAMMGPDYVQWHGFYEIAKHFYFKFIPAAQKIGGKKTQLYIRTLLKMPEHQWIKGKKPENLKLQEKSFSTWKHNYQDAINKKNIK